MVRSALRIHELTRRMGGAVVLDRLSLDLVEGEFSFLLGPSGCGKTTLLRLVAGLDRPDSGTIELFGAVVADPRSRVPPEARGVGMVFQQDALWPHMTVTEHLEFVLGPIDREQRRQRIDELLRLVRLEPLKARRPSNLSGGERQRLSLARALARSPRLLLLDEPTRNLDRALARELRREFAEVLRRQGVTALYVTHDHEEAFALADRILLLEAGRIRAVGQPEELYRDPPDAAAARLFGLATCMRGVIDANGNAATALGSFTTRIDPGSAYVAYFRPEDVAIAVDGEPGTVLVSRFLGTHRAMVVDVRGTHVELAVAPADDRVAGAAVRVRALRPPSVFAEPAS